MKCASWIHAAAMWTLLCIPLRLVLAVRKRSQDFTSLDAVSQETRLQQKDKHLQNRVDGAVEVDKGKELLWKKWLEGDLSLKYVKDRPTPRWADGYGTLGIKRTGKLPDNPHNAMQKLELKDVYFDIVFRCPHRRNTLIGADGTGWSTKVWNGPERQPSMWALASGMGTIGSANTWDSIYILYGDKTQEAAAPKFIPLTRANYSERIWDYDGVDQCTFTIEATPSDKGQKDASNKRVFGKGKLMDAEFAKFEGNGQTHLLALEFDINCRKPRDRFWYSKDLESNLERKPFLLKSDVFAKSPNFYGGNRQYSTFCTHNSTTGALILKVGETKKEGTSWFTVSRMLMYLHKGAHGYSDGREH